MTLLCHPRTRLEKRGEREKEFIGVCSTKQTNKQRASEVCFFFHAGSFSPPKKHVLSIHTHRQRQVKQSPKNSTLTTTHFLSLSPYVIEIHQPKTYIDKHIHTHTHTHTLSFSHKHTHIYTKHIYIYVPLESLVKLVLENLVY